MQMHLFFFTQLLVKGLYEIVMEQGEVGSVV